MHEAELASADSCDQSTACGGEGTQVTNGSGRCCHPELTVPVFSPTVKAAIAPTLLDVQPFLVAVDSTPVCAGCFDTECVRQNRYRLPGTDLVIAHQVFVI